MAFGLWIVSFLLFVGVCSSLELSEHDWTKITSPLDSPKYAEILSRFYPTIPNFSRQPKIVGGEVAAEGQFPFQVAMFLNAATGSFFCGGSIIHQNWVLTASHCLENILNAEVYVGVHDIAVGPAWWGKSVQLKDLIMHEKYDAERLNNDIALVRLTTAIPLTAKVSIISLPTRAMRTTTFENYNAIISGFGRDSDKATGISRVMRFVAQKIVSNSVCANYYGTSIVTERNLCTSGDGGKSSCQGDSGGPLQLTVSGQVIQVGVVSFGAAKGCELGYPAAFSRVSMFLDWIQEKTGMVLP